MNIIKLACLALVFFLAGCHTGGFGPAPGSEPIIEIGRMISDQNEINKLPPAERCERIRVDLRDDCRKKVKKEVDELSEAMKKHN